MLSATESSAPACPPGGRSRFRVGPAPPSSMAPITAPSSRRAPVAVVDAGDDLAERRLSCAILAEKRVHLAGHHVQRHGSSAITPGNHSDMSPNSTRGVNGASRREDPACNAPTIQTIKALAGRGHAVPAARLDHRPVDDLDLGAPTGLDVLQHGRLAAHRLCEEAGNGRPPLVVASPMPWALATATTSPQTAAIVARRPRATTSSFAKNRSSAAVGRVQPLSASFFQISVTIVRRDRRRAGLP